MQGGGKIIPPLFIMIRYQGLYLSIYYLNYIILDIMKIVLTNNDCITIINNIQIILK